MNRLLLGTILTLILIPGWAMGQTNYYRPGYGPYSRPPVSPYLNLLRGGNPAVNYYLGVLPEFQRQAANQQFRSDIRELDRKVGELSEEELPTLPGTGHPAQFGNYGPYYQFGPATPPRAAPSSSSRRSHFGR